MRSHIAVFLIFVFLAKFEIQAKTYYFNVNKTTNEFMVRNRVNMNHTASTYPRIHLGELRNIRNNTISNVS